jgi:hypothetical protein
MPIPHKGKTKKVKIEGVMGGTKACGDISSRSDSALFEELLERILGSRERPQKEWRR